MDKFSFILNATQQYYKSLPADEQDEVFKQAHGIVTDVIDKIGATSNQPAFMTIVTVWCFITAIEASWEEFNANSEPPAN